MGSPLLPITRLTACPACAEHVKIGEETCPHCGALLGGPRGLRAWAAGLALAGVMLASCNEGKDDSTIDTAAETIYGVTYPGSTGTTDGSGATTGESMTGEPTTGATTTSTGSTGAPTTGGDDTTTTTGTGTSTGSDTGSTDDTGSTGSEPDYGVPQTTGTGTT